MKFNFKSAPKARGARVVLAFAAGLLCMCPGAWANSKTKGTITMTCFPPAPPPGQPPGIGSPPPCVLPVGVSSQFMSPNPNGTATFTVNKDNTVTFDINVSGLAPNMVVSAWLVWYFPGITTPPDPIFIGSPPVADLSVPMAPTTAGFFSGLGMDPNRLTLSKDGTSGSLQVTLDYNPLQAQQGPLRNALAFVNQSLAPAGNVAFQPLCCPGTSYDPVGAAFLRVFDPAATGFQLLGANGLPELVRSPVAGAFIAIVSHLDLQTHGIVAGIPILPIPGQPVSSGDHFLIGLFDLRAFE